MLRPGDVRGLEALATAHGHSNAIALTDVAVCRIPLEVIHTLGASSQQPAALPQADAKWQKTLKDADDQLADLSFGTARQRVANFILKMRSPTDEQVATLSAGDDMGVMLDLKRETVSREVSRSVREEVIEPMGRYGRVYRSLQVEHLQLV